MRGSRPGRWILALVLLCLVCAAGALAANGGSVALLVEADDYSTTVTAGVDPDSGVMMTQEQYEHVNALYVHSQTLYDLIAPLTVGALGSAFAVIGVLAARRDRQRRDAIGQTEAPAAS